MTTTMQAGTVYTIFGIDSIASTIASSVGEFAEDFDLPTLENKYRDQLEGLLPDGWTISGDEVYRTDWAEDIEDRDELRAEVAQVDVDYSKDDMAGWLTKAQRDLVEAEERATELRNRRNQVVGIVTDGGMSGYRAAQILGISETAVSKIRRAAEAASTIPPDCWCQHCEQAVRLTSGRHFCEVLMAYVFGIELEPMTAERLALWGATS